MDLSGPPPAALNLTPAFPQTTSGQVLAELDALTFQGGLLSWSRRGGSDEAPVWRAGLGVPLQPGAQLPGDAYGGMAAPNWPGLSREDGRLRLELELPRWQMFPTPHPRSLAWSAQRGAGGELLSLVALMARLRADLHPLMPPTERPGMHELLAATGWDDALRREEALDASTDIDGRSAFPEPIDLQPQARLGGALVLLRSLDGTPLTLITPCGEALRRSIAESAGLVSPPTGKRVPRRWTAQAPVPELHLKLDTLSGLQALPWRLHWGARDAVLERHGWRSTWEGDWDGRAMQRDGIELEFKFSPTAALRVEARVEGRLYLGELRERGEATLT